MSESKFATKKGSVVPSKDDKVELTGEEEGEEEKKMVSVKSGAAKVFFSVSPLFLVVAFFLAINSTYAGLALVGGWNLGELVVTSVVEQ